MPISFLRGDATAPQADGPAIIPHIVNTEGAWGRGFVLAVSSRWSAPEAYYRHWHKLRRIHGVMLQNPLPEMFVSTSGDFVLGQVQIVQVAKDLYVANMIAQEGIGKNKKGLAPIRYEALGKCLEKVNRYAESLEASIHMPRIGCSLAGGSWSVVELWVKKALGRRDVTVYDLPGSKYNP